MVEKSLTDIRQINTGLNLLPSKTTITKTTTLRVMLPNAGK